MGLLAIPLSSLESQQFKILIVLGLGCFVFLFFCFFSCVGVPYASWILSCFILTCAILVWVFFNCLNQSDFSDVLLAHHQPWSQPFLQGALVPFGGKWHLETNLGARFTHFSWEVAVPRACHWSELERMSVCMCIYLYWFLHPYVENHEPVTSIPQFSIHHHRIHSSFFPFHDCNFPFKREKSGSHCPQYIYLLLHPSV